MARLLERLDARLNPLMVKEAQQSLRSRPLVVGGFLALAVPLVLFLLRMAASSLTSSESDAQGREYFWMLSGTAGLVTWGIVPGRAAQQLHAEIKSRTIDLITLSGLSPWQLAIGRWQAAVLQVALVLAFLSPFAMASMMMGGIGLDGVMTALAAITLVALAQVAAGLLAASAQLVSPRLGPLALVGFAMQLFFFASFGIGMLFEPVNPELSVMVWIGLMVALLTLLFLRMSADILTPSGSRTSAWSKLLLVLLLGVLYVQLWSGDAIISTVTGSGQEVLLFAGMFVLHAFALVWSSADARPGPGPRVLRFVLGDGCEATLAFTGLVSLSAAALAAMRGVEVWAPLLFSLYLLFFCGIAALLRSFFPRAAASDAYFVALVATIIVNLLATAVYQALFGLGSSRPPTSVFLVLLPLAWIDHGVKELSYYFLVPPAIGLLALVIAHLRSAGRAA